jgi:hypothetical protein
MKLSKIGYSQDKDVTILADNQLGPLEPWVAFQDGWILLLQLKGIEGPSTYDYHVQFSAAELALLVENALIGASQNGAIHAQAKGMGAVIREVLDVKNKPANT